MNPQMKQSKESTSSSTSRDSGVIIIDNTTTFTSRNSSDNDDKQPDPANNPNKENAEKAQAKTKHKTNYEFGKSSNNHNHKKISIENTLNVSQHPHTQHPPGGGSPTTSSVNTSPSLSIRSSSRISIVSIDENAPDSSVVDSDSDQDAEGIHANYTVQKLGQQTTYPAGSPQISDINKGLTVLSQTFSPALRSDNSKAALGVVPTPSTTNPSQIASIALTNSTDVTFGDKHFYEGPVTIQQFLIDNREKWKSGSNSADGQDNPTYTSHDEEGKSVPNGAHFKTHENPTPEQPYKFIFHRKAVIITGSVIVFTILAGILLWASTSVFKQTINKTDNDNIDDYPSPYNGSLLVVSRNGWYGRPPKDNKPDMLQLPVHRVIIMHTATDICQSIAVCSQRIQTIQDYHMDSQNWDDIGYNFLIGGDALVYMGRGWDVMGANVKGYNTDSVGIAFIGTYSLTKPTEAQLKSLDLLLQDGIKHNKLVPDYRLYGARQLSATESPGRYLFDVVKNMTHWSQIL